MLLKESLWLRDALNAVPVPELSPLLNLGSSTAYFRETVQPYIDREIFAPLRARGVRVVHCDLKQEEGVDIACDLLGDDAPKRIAAISPRAVLCSNMFEHVASRPIWAARLAELLPPGGLLILTVPHSYPYHPDPIDNGFRPDPAELAALFPGWAALSSAVVADKSFGQMIGEKPLYGVRMLLRSLIPWPRPRSWRSAVGHWAWLFRPYKVTCLLLRKP